MKRRMLALIPCIVFFLGVLTACTGTGSTGGGTRQFTGYTWHLQQTSGLEDLDEMPTEVLYFVTFRFDPDGTLTMGALGEVYETFEWYAKGNTITLYIPGSGYGTLTYSVNGNAMILRNSQMYMRLIR